MADKTHDGSPTIDQRLLSSMADFAQAFTRANMNGNGEFEFDPAQLGIQQRLTIIHINSLIEILVAGGMPAQLINERFAQNIEAETAKFKAPLIAQSVGQIIRR